MRIISKFHDYYDTALALGQDSGVVYRREPGLTACTLSPDEVPWLVKFRTRETGLRSAVVWDKIAVAKEPARPWRSSLENESDFRWPLVEAFVLVSGKAHPVWIAPGHGDELTAAESVGCCRTLGGTDLDSLAVYMARRREEQGSTLARPPGKMDIVARVKGEDSSDRERRQAARAYGEAKVRFLERDFTSLHLEVGAPVLLLTSPDALYSGYSKKDCARRAEIFKDSSHNVAVIKNPRLEDLRFQRVLDPFSCFQAISQFIEGVVPGQQMPMVEISDQSKILKKGFDPVYGFRTRPHGKQS